MRRLSERSGEGGRSGERRRSRGNEGVPGGNEGVGEHVRTRFHAGLLAPLKLRVVRIPAPNEEKLVSSAGPVLKERASFERTLFRNTIQPFDLMSRRHPLFVDQSLQTFIRGSNDVPASSRRQSWRSEVTSSSWRPCGSSSQSSSLRSSPSLPS